MRSLPGTGPEYARLRPLLLLAFLGVLPILALAVFAYVLSSRAVERLVQDGNHATAIMTAAFVERDFDQWAFTLTSYAGFPVLSGAIASGDVSEVERRLEIIVRENPRIDRAFVTDLTGLLWADFPLASDSRGQRFDHRDWYRGVARGRSPYVPETYIRHAEPPLLMVAVAVPVPDPQTGEPVGFLVGQVLPDGIAGLLGQVGVGAAGTVILVDHTGTLVAHPRLDLRHEPRREYADLVPTLTAPDDQVSRGNYEDVLTGEAMIASFKRTRVGEHRWTVVAKQPIEAAFAPVRGLALQIGGAGLLLGFVVFGLTGGLIRENTRRAEADRALEGMNQDLERLVDERTQELRKAHEDLYHARKLESVGRLAGGIAHDFNNLLTVIIGSARLLRDAHPDGSQERQDVEDLNAAGEQAAELTRQLLAFSRKQVMRPEILDVNAAVERMQGILERVIGEDVDLVFKLGNDLHPVKFDPGQVDQVVMNLVVNARDAMPRGGKLTVKTGNVDLAEEYARTHPGARSGPHVMLAVTDTGQGMDAETRERIFEPFFTTKGLGRGTGLGLATVYGS